MFCLDKPVIILDDFSQGLSLSILDGVENDTTQRIVLVVLEVQGA